MKRRTFKVFPNAEKFGLPLRQQKGKRDVGWLPRFYSRTVKPMKMNPHRRLEIEIGIHEVGLDYFEGGQERG